MAISSPVLGSLFFLCGVVFLLCNRLRELVENRILVCRGGQAMDLKGVKGV